MKLDRIKLRELRRTKGILSEKFADLVGISKGYISRIENGKDTPSQALLIRMAEALDVEPSAICMDPPAGFDSLKVSVDIIWPKLPKHAQAAVYAYMERLLVQAEKEKAEAERDSGAHKANESGTTR